MAKSRSPGGSSPRKPRKTAPPPAADPAPASLPPAAVPSAAVESVLPAPSPEATAPPVAVPRPTQEQIRRRAYEIWVAKGRPIGQDLENWRQAERELTALASRK